MRLFARLVLSAVGCANMSMNVWTILGLGLLAVYVPGAANAQDERPRERGDTVFRINEIVVQAAKPVTTVGGSSAIEVQIDSLVLPASPTLEDVLRRVPGIHVRTNSRGEAEITVRGSDSRQVAVLYDGVPLTAGWDARTDVSVIPANAPRELTLVRGLSSVLYGPNTLGGVVEVGVGRGASLQERPSVQFTSGIDDAGGVGASGSFAVPLLTDRGEWLIRAGGGFRDRSGLPLAEGVVEPVLADNANLRLNTDLKNIDGFMALRYAAEGGSWFSLAGSGFSAERGIAAELGSPEPRFWRYPTVRRMVAVASGGTGDRQTPFGGRGDLEASIGMDVGRTEIQSFTSRAYDEIAGTEAGEDRTLTLRLLGDHTLGQRADLRAAFTYSDINHDEIIDGGPANEYRQRLFSFGTETVFRLVDGGSGAIDDLRLSIGAVVDMGDTPKSADKPPLGRLTEWGGRLGVSALLNDGRTVVHGSVSRRPRFPALRELYSGALGRFDPNPGLTPEMLFAAEAGITTQVGSGELQAVAFHHDLNDAVVRITTPQGLLRRVNANQVRSTGVELLGSYMVGAVSVGGDLTLQSVDRTDKATGESHEPENQPSVFGSVNVRFPLPLAVKAFTEARYTGEQFCLDFNTGEDVELRDGARLNLDLSRQFQVRQAGSSWLSRIEARVGVDNLTDIAIYDQCGLPQPGRLVSVQVRLF